MSDLFGDDTLRKCNKDINNLDNIRNTFLKLNLQKDNDENKIIKHNKKNEIDLFYSAKNDQGVIFSNRNKIDIDLYSEGISPLSISTLVFSNNLKNLVNNSKEKTKKKENEYDIFYLNKDKLKIKNNSIMNENLINDSIKLNSSLDEISKINFMQNLKKNKHDNNTDEKNRGKIDKLEQRKYFNNHINNLKLGYLYNKKFGSDYIQNGDLKENKENVRILKNYITSCNNLNYSRIYQTEVLKKNEKSNSILHKHEETKKKKNSILENINNVNTKYSPISRNKNNLLIHFNHTNNSENVKKINTNNLTSNSRILQNKCIQSKNESLLGIPSNSSSYKNNKLSLKTVNELIFEVNKEEEHLNMSNNLNKYINVTKNNENITELLGKKKEKEHFTKDTKKNSNYIFMNYINDLKKKKQYLENMEKFNDYRKNSCIKNLDKVIKNYDLRGSFDFNHSKNITINKNLKNIYFKKKVHKVNTKLKIYENLLDFEKEFITKNCIQKITKKENDISYKNTENANNKKNILYLNKSNNCAKYKHNIKKKNSNKQLVSLNEVNVFNENKEIKKGINLINFPINFKLKKNLKNYKNDNDNLSKKNYINSLFMDNYDKNKQMNELKNYKHCNFNKIEINEEKEFLNSFIENDINDKKNIPISTFFNINDEINSNIETLSNYSSQLNHEENKILNNNKIEDNKVHILKLENNIYKQKKNENKNICEEITQHMEYKYNYDNKEIPQRMEKNMPKNIIHKTQSEKSVMLKEDIQYNFSKIKNYNTYEKDNINKEYKNEENYSIKSLYKNMYEKNKKNNKKSSRYYHIKGVIKEENKLKEFNGRKKELYKNGDNTTATNENYNYNLETFNNENNEIGCENLKIENYNSEVKCFNNETKKENTKDDTNNNNNNEIECNDNKNKTENIKNEEDNENDSKIEILNDELNSGSTKNKMDNENDNNEIKIKNMKNEVDNVTHNNEFQFFNNEINNQIEKNEKDNENDDNKIESVNNEDKIKNSKREMDNENDNNYENNIDKEDIFENEILKYENIYALGEMDNQSTTENEKKKNENDDNGNGFIIYNEDRKVEDNKNGSKIDNNKEGENYYETENIKNGNYKREDGSINSENKNIKNENKHKENENIIYENLYKIENNNSKCENENSNNEYSNKNKSSDYENTSDFKYQNKKIINNYEDKESINDNEYLVINTNNDENKNKKGNGENTRNKNKNKENEYAYNEIEYEIVNRESDYENKENVSNNYKNNEIEYEIVNRESDYENKENVSNNYKNNEIEYGNISVNRKYKTQNENDENNRNINENDENNKNINENDENNKNINENDKNNKNINENDNLYFGNNYIKKEICFLGENVEYDYLKKNNGNDENLIQDVFEEHNYNIKNKKETSEDENLETIDIMLKEKVELRKTQKCSHVENFNKKTIYKMIQNELLYKHNQYPEDNETTKNEEYQDNLSKTISYIEISKTSNNEIIKEFNNLCIKINKYNLFKCLNIKEERLNYISFLYDSFDYYNKILESENKKNHICNNEVKKDILNSNKYKKYFEDKLINIFNLNLIENDDINTYNLENSEELSINEDKNDLSNSSHHINKKINYSINEKSETSKYEFVNLAKNVKNNLIHNDISIWNTKEKNDEAEGKNVYYSDENDEDNICYEDIKRNIWLQNHEFHKNIERKNFVNYIKLESVKCIILFCYLYDIKYFQGMHDMIISLFYLNLETYEIFCVFEKILHYYAPYLYLRNNFKNKYSLIDVSINNITNNCKIEDISMHICKFNGELFRLLFQFFFPHISYYFDTSINESWSSFFFVNLNFSKFTNVYYLLYIWMKLIEIKEDKKVVTCDFILYLLSFFRYKLKIIKQKFYKKEHFLNVNKNYNFIDYGNFKKDTMKESEQKVEDIKQVNNEEYERHKEGETKQQEYENKEEKEKKKEYIKKKKLSFYCKHMFSLIFEFNSSFDDHFNDDFKMHVDNIITNISKIKEIIPTSIIDLIASYNSMYQKEQLLEQNENIDKNISSNLTKDLDNNSCLNIKISDLFSIYNNKYYEFVFIKVFKEKIILSKLNFINISNIHVENFAELRNVDEFLKYRKKLGNVFKSNKKILYIIYSNEKDMQLIDNETNSCINNTYINNTEFSDNDKNINKNRFIDKFFFKRNAKGNTMINKLNDSKLDKKYLHNFIITLLKNNIKHLTVLNEDNSVIKIINEKKYIEEEIINNKSLNENSFFFKVIKKVKSKLYGNAIKEDVVNKNTYIKENMLQNNNLMIASNDSNLKIFSDMKIKKKVNLKKKKTILDYKNNLRKKRNEKPKNKLNKVERVLYYKLEKKLNRSIAPCKKYKESDKNNLFNIFKENKDRKYINLNKKEYTNMMNNLNLKNNLIFKKNRRQKLNSNIKLHNFMSLRLKKKKTRTSKRKGKRIKIIVDTSKKREIKATRDKLYSNITPLHNKISTYKKSDTTNSSVENSNKELNINLINNVEIDNFINDRVKKSLSNENELSFLDLQERYINGLLSEKCSQNNKQDYKKNIC
ncbi:LOW QUALITY PROTEIN: conserved Plasmodium protein, unknown function [Plasmodium relictum]|uniref:Uncharacterized protein n=1 Tax=Plasmodium relictum TaxID=85471 RepID=A0A1J1H610_PLARL|nr:LOW QUALITY PROTEIN: conserved Plasmodium protein, unknown function [Plasmodium relictum]CRH00352.1 conserved Plasmodium protein, unknown function [Plasmodium relictum]